MTNFGGARMAEFRRRYAAAFHTHIQAPAEPTLLAAYELGRDAVESGLPLVDVAAVHHEVLFQAIRSAALVEVEQSLAAGDFLIESLSAFEMVHRGLREISDYAFVEHRRNMMIRRLSNLLSDASLTGRDGGSLREALQLVAEHARELSGSAACVVRVAADGDGGRPVEVSAHSDPDADGNAFGARPRPDFSVPLRTLDGRSVGVLEVVATRGNELTELDEELLRHVAEMASATIERARGYTPGPKAPRR
jgi:GAF domain-containing protein